MNRGAVIAIAAVTWTPAVAMAEVSDKVPGYGELLVEMAVNLGLALAFGRVAQTHRWFWAAIPIWALGMVWFLGITEELVWGDLGEAVRLELGRGYQALVVLATIGIPAWVGRALVQRFLVRSARDQV